MKFSGSGSWSRLHFAVLCGVLGVAPLISACGGNSVADFCTQAKQAAADESKLGSLSSSNPDLNQIKSELQSAAASLDKVDNAAPQAIAADTHKLRVALDKIASQAQSAKTLQDLYTALIAGLTPDLNKSADNIDAYTQKNCGFTFSSATPSP